MNTLNKWLQQLPKSSLEQQCEDLANMLRAKEQALETASHDLKVKASSLQVLEQKIMSSETLFTAAQRELTARAERVKALEADLAAQTRQLTDAEAEGVSARQRIGELNATVTALANELRAAQQTYQTSEQGHDVLKEEIRVLREHIAQLNEGLADRDRLRAQVEKLEAGHDRVHQLEIALSDREVAHRNVIQQFEQSLLERDRRISEFDGRLGIQMDELHAAQQACRTAEQAQEVLREEIRVLRDHIAQLNAGLADRDRLRAHLEKLASVQDRVHQLEVELSNREAAHRGTIQQFEQSISERDHRIRHFDSHAAAQADELHSAHQARQAAEQAREVQEQEIRVLRDHIAQLNEGLAERDRLREHLKQFESVQGRVHQLEVELSDREAAHRGTIKQLEKTLAERDRRIGEFDTRLAAQVEEFHAAQQACQTAEQAQEVLKEEVRVLRDHIAQLNEGLSDRDRLREHLMQFESVQGRVHQLEVELSDREAAHRGIIKQLEQSLAERDRRIGEFDTQIAAQVEESQAAQQACRTAEQAQDVLKEEIRVLRNHIAQLNENLGDQERLRTHLKKFESVQGRVHQLEVELSDREAAHRGIIKQLEKSLAERDRRIEELVPATHLLREKGTELKEWEKKYARTVQEHQTEVAKLQEQCSAQEQLREQLLLSGQQLHGRDEQIEALTRQLHNVQEEHHKLTQEVQSIPGKDEQIDRLQKRLKELRGELREKTVSPVASPRETTQSTVKSPAQATQAKVAPVVQPAKVIKETQEDDLKKIQGIGPVFAQALQKLGIRTFNQIARWKPEDIAKIAKKLDIEPERIKREHWMASAKKQHDLKYGKRP